jgi:hypothetical protein
LTINYFGCGEIKEPREECNSDWVSKDIDKVDLFELIIITAKF